MRVVINAQLDPQTSGGIAQVLIGLAHALGQLDGPEQYIFVCSPHSGAWLAPYIANNTSIEINSCKPLPPTSGVRESDGFWESYQPDVLHFPFQSYTRTSLPTIFNPHDLQHIHLPELFTSHEYQRRELLYRQACDHASAIPVASRFVRDDLINTYNIDAGKINVIPWAPPTMAYTSPHTADVDTVRMRYDIPRSFAIYPAQTWPHKNHLRLLDALAELHHTYKQDISLVCTGTKTDYFKVIDSHAKKIGMQSHVHFVGRIPEEDLVALYRLADFMIVPTLFEAASFPVFEAFAESVAVACSHVTSLPEQVGNAAILFDPYDVHAIAKAMNQLSQDVTLREELMARGQAQLATYSWLSTARQYRDLYRLIVQRSEATTNNNLELTQ